MRLIWILFILLQLSVNYFTETVRYEDSWIHINDIEIRDKEDHHKLHQYSNYTTVVFHNASITALSIEALQQMKALEKLSSYNGKINSLYVPPNLKVVDFFKTIVRNIVIEAAYDYKLTELVLYKGEELTALPKNFNLLKNLEVLIIRFSKIEYINTDDFNHLHMLRVLDLEVNQISKISSSLNEPIDLPSLQYLQLSFNNLSEISFINWNAASLVELGLSYNHLTMVQSLLSVSSSLNELQLYANPVNCRWLYAISSELADSVIKMSEDKRLECENSQRSIDQKHTDEIFQIKLHKLSSTLRKQSIRLEDSESKINQCFAKIEQLLHLNDDLTAAFYQYTLENTNDQSLTGKK